MVSIVGSISLGLLLTRAVILPITRTTELAERISHGDYSINWDFVGGSEQLDIALKKMVLELAAKSKDNERHKIKLAKTNESLRTSNEELTQFSYRTSHDLRAPLITIRRLAEAIQEDISDGNESEANDNLVHVITYVRKLENLVVDILDLAKADVEIEKSSPVNIHELLISIKERLNQTYYENKVTITIDVNPDLEVVVSKVRITQILENLLSNAIKYNDPSKDESTVKVAVFEKDKKYVLVVEDNGVGIPEGYFDKIFLMFQRFHPERCDGSGLGLYIIKKHVDRMHGNIAFSSSNKGTTFTIEIPFIS
jgi:signal transduction histidine kinase